MNAFRCLLMHMSRYLNGALAIALVMPISLQAAEWSVEPKISLRAGRDDNIRLTTQPHSPVWESTLSPSVKFAVAQENQGLSGDAGLKIRRFTGGTGRERSELLDREDYYLNSDVFHQTLHDVFRANLDYTQDSTLDTQLDETGNVSARATRERLALGPSWSRTLTERARMDLTYQYSNVGYSDDAGANLVGYDYHVASGTLVRQFTPRIQGSVVAAYSSYLPDTLLGLNSDTVSLQAGVTANISETLVASALLGQRSTTSDRLISTGFCIGADPGATYPSCTGGIPIPTGAAKGTLDTTSPVYSASLTKTLETGSLSASLSRSSSPSSDGELLDVTRLALAGTYKLSEMLSSSLRVEYTENETIVNRLGSAPTQGKETFFRVTPRAAWRWNREWELAGEYQYARNEDPRIRGSAGDTATRNAFYVTLYYRPVKTSVSR